MVFAGLVVTLLGFVLSVSSLGLTDSVNARMGMVIAGIVISLVGIIGIINTAFLKNAIWKK